MSTCKFCSRDITWEKEGRKNVPIESDGTKHSCQEMLDAMKSIKKMNRDTLSSEEIKKYEEAINKKANKK